MIMLFRHLHGLHVLLSLSINLNQSAFSLKIISSETALEKSLASRVVSIILAAFKTGLKFTILYTYSLCCYNVFLVSFVKSCHPLQ